MKRSKPVIAAIVLTVWATQIARAADLRPGTLTAWNAYVKQADAHMQERAAGRQTFLWMDESPDRAARVRRGEVVLAPVVNHGTEGVSHGLVHDWIGAVFIPGATVDSLWSVVPMIDRSGSRKPPSG